MNTKLPRRLWLKILGEFRIIDDIKLFLGNNIVLFKYMSAKQKANYRTLLKSRSIEDELYDIKGTNVNWIVDLILDVPFNYNLEKLLYSCCLNGDVKNLNRVMNHFIEWNWDRQTVHKLMNTNCRRGNIDMVKWICNNLINDTFAIYFGHHYCFANAIVGLQREVLKYLSEVFDTVTGTYGNDMFIDYLINECDSVNSDDIINILRLASEVTGKSFDYLSDKLFFKSYKEDIVMKIVDNSEDPVAMFKYEGVLRDLIMRQLEGPFDFYRKHFPEKCTSEILAYTMLKSVGCPNISQWLYNYLNSNGLVSEETKYKLCDMAIEKRDYLLLDSL
jgi:hypothetical protein